MNKEELDKKIHDIENINSVEDCKKMIDSINDGLEKTNGDEVERTLEFLKELLKIQIVKININELDNKDYKKSIELRGQLIKLYKNAEKKATTEEYGMKYRYEQIQELKRQKGIIHEYRKNKDTKISIPKKIALTIKEVAKSIEIFAKEKDVVTKVKNTVKGIATGALSVGVIAGGTALASFAIMGIPVTLSSIVSAFPALAYVGLSTIIHNMTSKTKFERYQYLQSEEFKKISEAFYNENKEVLSEIAKLTKEKEDIDDIEVKIDINDQLIDKIQKVISFAKVDEIKESFELQELSYYQENRDLCKQIIDEYLDEKNNDKEKYEKFNKKLKNINIQIFKKANSIKTAVKHAGKSIIKNSAVLLVAHLLLHTIAPGTFPLTAKGLLTPLAVAVISGIIDIPTFKEKLKYKPTEYKGKIKEKNKKRIEEILNEYDNNLVLA